MSDRDSQHLHVELLLLHTGSVAFCLIAAGLLLLRAVDARASGCSDNAFELIGPFALLIIRGLRSHG